MLDGATQEREGGTPPGGHGSVPFSVTEFSAEEVREVWPLVWTLEGLALRASPAIPEKIEALERINRDIESRCQRPRECAELDAEWHRTLVRDTRNGRLTATLGALTDVVRRYEYRFLDSPDQAHYGTPIETITRNAEGIYTFDIPDMGIRYAGKPSEDGKRLEGHFEQSGLRFRVDCERNDKPKEWPRPQTPRPPFPYRSVELTYDSRDPGVRLAGTLTLPQGDGPFPAAILADPTGHAGFSARYRQILDEVWDADALLAEIDRMEGLLGTAASPGSINEVRDFVSSRRADVESMLDGGLPRTVELSPGLCNIL